MSSIIELFTRLKRLQEGKGVTIRVEKQYRYQLDEEWINLIVQAKNLGLEVEEIRQFLQNKK